MGTFAFWRPVLALYVRFQPRKLRPVGNLGCSILGSFALEAIEAVASRLGRWVRIWPRFWPPRSSRMRPYGLENSSCIHTVHTASKIGTWGFSGPLSPIMSSILTSTASIFSKPQVSDWFSVLVLFHRVLLAPKPSALWSSTRLTSSSLEDQCQNFLTISIWHSSRQVVTKCTFYISINILNHRAPFFQFQVHSKWMNT